MKTSVKYKVNELAWPERTFIGKRAVVSFDKLTPFFSKSYMETENELQKLNVAPIGAPLAIYYAIDEEKNETDLAAVYPVSGLKSSPEGFVKVDIKPSKVLTTTYTGPYEGVAVAYEEMEDYMQEHGYEKVLSIEEYLTDPMVEPNPEKWITNIYFVLK